MLTPRIHGICWRLLTYFLLAENPRVLQVVKHVPWTKQTARHRLIFPNFTLRKSFQDRENDEFDTLSAFEYHSRDLSYWWLNLAENQERQSPPRCSTEPNVMSPADRLMQQSCCQHLCVLPSQAMQTHRFELALAWTSTLPHSFFVTWYTSSFFVTWYSAAPRTSYSYLEIQNFRQFSSRGDGALSSLLALLRIADSVDP